MTETALSRPSPANPEDELFTQLVREHIDLVYSAARRQVRDPGMAADITQAVFILLAQRAGKTKGSLAGWLILTTNLTARNAKKMQARRIKHERRAAQMKVASATADEPADWKVYEPYLDWALTSLREQDRDVLVARFLQSKSLRDVGQLIGVSEEAARKRVDRALAQLRQRLRSRLPMPAVAMLGSQLDHFASTKAPQAITDSIIRQGAVVKGGTVCALLHEVRMSGLLIKVKVVVVLVLMLVASSATAAFLASTGSKPKASSPPAPISPLTPPPAPISLIDANEANRPGIMQVARWTVLLDQRGAEAIDAVGKKVATASKVYQAMLCNSALLRQAVSGEMAAGHVVGVAHDVDVVPVAPGGRDPNHQYQLNFNYRSQNPPLTFYGGANDFDYDLTQMGVRRGRLQLNHPKLWIRLNENDWHEKESAPSLMCDQELTPGQSIAFLGRFTAPNGRRYGHLLVWEAYAATAHEAATMLWQRDAGWWCEHGPDLLRRWADQEFEWGDTAGGRAMGPPSIGRRLDDGETIWLFALIRPAQWPLCWWDPTGKPASPWWNAFTLDGDPPKGLMAQVEVSPMGVKRGAGEPEDELPNQETHPIPDDAKQFEVGVPIGPWQEVGRLKAGDSITRDGIRYEIVKMPESTNNFSLQVTGVLNDDFRAIPVASDGTQESLNQSRTLKWENETVPRTYQIFLPIDGNPVSFIVKRRHRQYVTFSGFATNPKTRPPDCPTTAQADALVESMQTQALEKYLKQFPNQRLGRAMQWFPGKPDDYLNATNVFLHAAVLGDQKTVRHMMTASDPHLSSRLDTLAHVICQGQMLRRSATQRYGEQAAHELLDRPGLFEDQIAELMTCGWMEVIGNDSPDGQPMQMGMQTWDDRLPPLTWWEGTDHLQYLEVDGLAAWPDIVERLDRAEAKLDRLQRLMARKDVSVADFQKLLADH